LVLEQQQSRGHSPVVGQVDLHARLLTGGHLRRRDGAHQSQPVAAASQEPRGGQRQQQQQRAYPDQLVVTEEQGAQERGASRGKEGPSADRQR